MTHQAADENTWNPKWQFQNNKRSKIRWQLIDVSKKLIILVFIKIYCIAYFACFFKEHEWKKRQFFNGETPCIQILSRQTNSLHWSSHNKLSNVFLCQVRKINYSFNGSNKFFAGEGPVSDDVFFVCCQFHCWIYGVWWNITQNNRLDPSLRVNILK